MLPIDVISHRYVGELIVPRWLAARDEPYVAEVLEAIASFDGLTVAEVVVLAEQQFDGRVAAALWAIERKRWTADVDAPVDPEAVRAVVFEQAAEMPAAEALVEASLVFGVTPEVLRGSLFADRASRRRLRAPERPSTPADLVARYNLAVVQSLLVRAMTIEASLEGDPRAIVRAARRDRLLVRVAEDGAATRLDVAGPLTLFHETLKYGRSIARLVPSLVAAPAWSLRARVVVRSRSAVLRLQHDDAVLPGGALPSLLATPLARRTARALHAAGVRVDLQPAVIRTQGVVIVPDFALEWGAGRRVYVDVLPFATEQHLAAKLETIERIDAPMILCVDDRWASVVSPRVIPFRGAIDAWTLLAAARNAAGLYTKSA